MSFSKVILKLLLAVMALICLLDMPYGYYQLFRVTAFVGFAFLAFSDENKGGWMLFYIASALIVQPFFKLPVGREVWNIVDVIWAVSLLFSALISKNK